jgi:hypothetical protein
MAGFSIAKGIDDTDFTRIADGLIIAGVVSLPWSTSATAVFAVLWAIALISLLSWADVRRELLTPAGGLPVVLVALGLAGILWAEVTAFERWKGFESYLKLLAIPLLLAQFRRRFRKRFFGTFGITSVGTLGADLLTPMAPVTSLLTYGPHEGNVFHCPARLGYSLGRSIRRREVNSSEFVVASL